MNAMRKDELSMHCTCTEETGREHPAGDSGESNCVQLTLAKPVVTPRKARSFKLGKWLLALAVISASTLYTICHPNWVPGFGAQPVAEPPVKIAKKASAPSVRSAAPASSKEVNSSGDSTSSGADQTLASDKDQGSHQGLTLPATAMAKTVEAKTSNPKTSLLVPPPPPTPYELPPGIAPEYATPQLHLQQAQAPDSLLSHYPSAGAIMPQQSDQDLQKIDQELEAAMRSSQLRGGQWQR